MEKIASFSVNHNLISRGIYISRKDYDITTYDIRMKKPNSELVLENGAIHTIEHLFATFVRNSAFAPHVIYFGPMGCRTGFYFLLKALPGKDAIELMKSTFTFIAGFSGEIPGVSAEECGNFREHDLENATREAAEFLKVIDKWDVSKLEY